MKDYTMERLEKESHRGKKAEKRKEQNLYCKLEAHDWAKPGKVEKFIFFFFW